MIVVDTSVLVDYLRGDQRAYRALRESLSRGDSLAASVLTRVEVLAGLRAGEEEVTERVFSLFAWISVDESIADRAGGLARRYLKTHPGVDPVDFVIAATAERTGAVLWTRNRKHFPMFPDLPDPYQS